MSHLFNSQNYGPGKIVRDLIPTEGRRLGFGEREAGLRVKLREEVDEFIDEKNTDDQLLEEAADVLEVVTALLEVRGLNIDQLVEVAEAKRAKKGAFKDCQFLREGVAVFSLPECPFHYCDAPGICKPAGKCHHA